MSHWVAKRVFMKVADFSDDENRSVGKGILSSVTEVWLEYIENAGDLLYTLYLPQTTGVDGFYCLRGVLILANEMKEVCMHINTCICAVSIYILCLYCRQQRWRRGMPLGQELNPKWCLVTFY